MGRDGNQVTFDLKDNGNIQEQITFGFGLSAMDQRVRMIGGTLTVGPRKDGKGAHLHICCPLVPGNAERAGKEFSL
ncbi:hypothetical protein [Melghiribacillus thermohalophilus]|uniref:hypothetical protein n=1 Tax=Melghiribacillus thermohalophilus TaxID=1324956 RepID=UPI001404696D|nr:hypothetical protein [Melghiribacillus thermohalophilus]